MVARIRELCGEAMANWFVPVVFALSTALAMWAVWYFTNVPCIMSRAESGLCNPSTVANFINIDILAKAGGGGLAVGALKGSYDRYMLNREREARRQAEEQLAEARTQADAVRQHADAVRQHADAVRQHADEAVAEERRKADAAYSMVTELIAEFREERRQNEEDRRQNTVTQQAMLETMRQLLQPRYNGGRPSTDDAETSTHE
jgi:hypothetical protein